ncbi:MAG: TonB-dependent receptor, partial [Azoarcus sp.]|nr:TonB-dependent receptor [Azoarcus sp.]
INLRGLGASQTLVLINGRRGAGVGSRGTSEATDQQNINNIPLAAIERIEVLPMSASAIYGANAIGGVVNIVLRRDYVGAEINGRYGNTFDSDTSVSSFNFVGGHAWNEGRTRMMLTAQRQQENPLRWKDRKFAEKGRARILARDPGTIYNNTANGSPPYGNLVNIRSADGVTPLTINGTSIGSTYTHIPKGYQGAAVDGVQPLIDNAGVYALGLSNGIGSFSGQSNYVGKSETDAAMLNLTHDITKTFNVFLDASYDYKKVESAGNYHGFGVVTVPANAPNNPFDQAVKVAYPANYGDGISLENRTVKTKGAHVAVGFNWEITPKWLLSFDYSHSWARNDLKYQRRPATSTGGCSPTKDCLTQAINNGTLDVLRDVTSYATDISPYWTEAPNFTEQKLDDVNLRVAGTVASWYAGEIKLATGVSRQYFWSEGRAEYSVMSDPNAATTIREQDSGSLYAELSVPFISPAMKLPWARLLEVQLAGRHDRYHNATVGSKFDATTPTIGFRFMPHETVLLRASWSKGFVVPTVAQIAEPTPGANPTKVTDPRDGMEYEVQTLGGGNPDIEPEESESTSFGIVLMPVSDLHISVDYYKIKKTNNITSLSAQNLLANEAYFGDRITRDPITGEIAQIYTGYFNGLWLETSGVDTNINYAADTPVGNLNLNLGYTYVDKYKQQLAFGAAPTDYLNLPTSGPLRHRLNASAYLKINKQWSAGWGMQYYGAYKIAPSSTAAIKQQGSDKVKALSSHDIFARYVLPRLSSHQGGTQIELTLGIKNLFDEYNRDMSQSTYLSIYSDPRGRQYYTNLKVSF